MPHSNITSKTRARAKTLRRDITKAEKIMWSILKDFNAQGASFRREAPIGPYIADFAWLSKRLTIEVDGDSHETVSGRKHDAVRDAFLKIEGFQILRFDNAQIVDNSDFVFLEIQKQIMQLLNSI
jgi:very-short-patch-repair endonuclease